MKLTITILGGDGVPKAAATGEGTVTLVYTAPYADGDVITLSGDGGDVVAQLEDTMAPAVGYLRGDYLLAVPFEEKRVSYSPKSFTGEMHLLWARAATGEEASGYRNLALNPLDSHENGGLFPHAYANVETRGESVFAARNAIDGVYANADHGPWPYQSWGINRQADAQFTLEFGRPVLLDKLVITLRADYPHDNWWRTGTVRFSDGTEFAPHFVKTGAPQSFAIAPRTVTALSFGELIADETDPSPFPALTQFEAWGTPSTQT